MIGGRPYSPTLGTVFEPRMVKEVMDEWLKDLYKNIQPKGYWFDSKLNKPTVDGLFYSIRFVGDTWYNENWGAYTVGDKTEKLFYRNTPDKWYFIFTGLNWTKELLEAEIDKQVKEFLEYYKMERIKKDFV